MSGDKKKRVKAQGWEEAGSEFYQESYPTDAEFDAIQRDPKHLATLLPSKQTRAVAATIRMRTHDNRTVRRQTASRSRRESTVHRRPSAAADVQVSMMPDLSENLSNEQTTWEEIMQIKAMPVPMSQKKEMKAKILNEPNLRLQGYEQFKWKRRKMWDQFRAGVSEFISNLELWQGTLKNIEGHFGTGVVAYFLFLKHLLFLNVFIFVFIFLFIILPTILLDGSNGCRSSTTVNSTLIEAAEKSTSFDIVDLIQGTGFMDNSLMFYGYYSNETFCYDVTESSAMYYNLPLAYICVTLVYLIVSLISIVRSAAGGFRERLVEGEGQFYQYCNLVFGGWDFCIHNQRSAAIKHRALFREIKGSLAAERLEELRQNRTRHERLKLILIKTTVNVFVLVVLAGCAFLIYVLFSLSNEREWTDCTVNFERLFYQFLPSIAIVILNIVVPFLFKWLIKFEGYSDAFVVKMSLARTVLLRLASIFTLCASMYLEYDQNRAGYSTTNSTCVNHNCWETYVGQQIYKLTITDFASHLLLTFFVNFPRGLIARHVDGRFAKMVGEQSFDLPKHVLDVVYSQTLCWLGCFYAPLLSLVFAIIFLVLFQIKRFACLVNSVPSATIYRASRSNSMFMLVLMVSFVSALLPLAYSISEMEPSTECGPFRHFDYVWAEVEDMFANSPIWLRELVSFLSTAGFAVPVFILLFLLLYYYQAVNSANRQMVIVLKNQLVLEGHDKQFLLERLSKFIKQQQQRMRRAEQVGADHSTASNITMSMNSNNVSNSN